MGPTIRRSSLLLSLVIALLTAPAALAAPPDPSPAGANDFECEPTKAHPRPVVLVHGLGATMGTNWRFHSPEIAAAGYCVFALTYGRDPRLAQQPISPGGVIPMEQSAPQLKQFVNKVLRRTDSRRVDLIGHSEGTVMPRYYLERLGGRRHVRRFIALTPLWRGTQLLGVDAVRDVGSAFGLSRPAIDLVASICGSCPQFIRGSDYLTDLNRDGEAIRGIKHTNIVTRYDELVIPHTSGLMRDGGTNIVIQDVCPLDFYEHGGVAVDPVVTQMFLNALDPKNERPVRC